MSSLAILIPNYNGSKFIGKTIENFRQGFPLATIIVVDDVSTDNSIEVLKTQQVKLLIREKNGGFAAAVNTGFKYILENNFNIILISNSDIEIDTDMSASVVRSLDVFNQKSQVGILGYLENSVHATKIRHGADISGFFFAMKKNVIEKIGYLDERFFMYGEEQDYFRRAIKAGFEIFQTEIKVGHLVEGSGKSKLKNSWLAIRNSIFLEAKNYNMTLVLKKIASLFLIINKIYRPKSSNDPSLIRVLRPGIVLGNVFLVSAIFWNVYKLITSRIHKYEPKP